MIVKTISSAIIGIDSFPVDVEVDITSGLPQFSTVGLPDASIRESKDRIKAAISNSGYKFPSHHVTINLAPANIRKEGTAFDLPIAIAILAAQEMVPLAPLSQYILLGELSLDGTVKEIQGALSSAFTARSLGIKGIVLPTENAGEAALVEGIDVIPVNTLSDVVEFFTMPGKISPFRVDINSIFTQKTALSLDFQDIKGQEQAKRAIEVATAGGHNIIMIGAPGSGKSMLAKRIVTIVPDMTLNEAIETTQIYSVAGLPGHREALIATRPFRSVHHTISDAGLVGGGHTPRPGEISLAHHGVLFLDELPEFKKNVLETLRQPLEEGKITIARSGQSVTYPASFALVAAMNPCPCGYYGDGTNRCRCSPQQIRQYQGRVSGPLLDRIDIHIEVPSVSYRDLTTKTREGEPSVVIKRRVEQAREIQKKRFSGDSTLCNARMNESQIRKFCTIDEESHKLVEMAVDKLGLSARAYTRILKVARTIADLDESEILTSSHVAEAIQYRSLDRRLV